MSIRFKRYTKKKMSIQKIYEKKIVLMLKQILIMMSQIGKLISRTAHDFFMN